MERMVVQPRNSVGQPQQYLKWRSQDAEDKITVGYGDFRPRQSDTRLEGYY